MFKVCEIYRSIQGEGPNAGEPATFLRFGGCNLRCMGWPCDSHFSVLPEYHDEWDHMEGHDVLEVIPTEPRRVCFTGGEPLIQSHDALTKLADRLVNRHHTIDLFTNGTKELPNWTRWWQVTVVADWKLPGSGEFGTFDLKNLERLKKSDCIKFTVADDIDFDAACKLIDQYDLTKHFRVVVGPVWNRVSEADLVQWILDELPCGSVKMNVQIHKYIWDPKARRR